jgi:hypothetical protein
MTKSYSYQAGDFMEKSNAGLQPELMSAEDARAELENYVRVRRATDFGIAALTRKIKDAETIAKVTGTSIARARETVATGEVLASSGELNDALMHGEVSLEQAVEIAKAEEAAPGAAAELVAVAKEQSFSVFRERARKTKLEAEQHRDLGERQRAARTARARVDELGMAEIYLHLQPHVGVPLMNRAETEARRLYKAAKKQGRQEPFERHLADAYSKMLAGGGKPSTTRPEVVYLVSWEVAQRGYREVRKGEVCKIPGRAPVDPREVKEIAERAFLNAVVSDGKDLRHFRRFGTHVTKELAIALELGDPPEFDGPRCVDCGSRFRLERDHVEPRNARGPTSKPNLKWRCDPCHEAKTERDRSAGKLKPKPKPEQKRKLKPKPDRKPRGP